MGKREEKALAVLAAGGYFRRALERAYVGGEKFVYRLYPAGAVARKENAVPGVGVKTFFALEKKLAYRACEKSSVWPTEWVLAPVA